MYELVQAGARTYYINCPAKIGIYRANDTDVYLLDSGNDKDAGRRVRQILEQNGWRLAAILNTHAHADHIGGNQYLQRQTGCAVFACGVETAFARYPILEPSLLYGGCPPKELRQKFLLAQASDARDITDAAFPREIGVIPLPGHFFDMVGFRTPDDVVFLADCLSGRETLDKYGIPFIYDVGAYLQTLDTVAALRACLFVPAHAEASADMRELVQYNRQKVLAVADNLLACCAAPQTFETILQAMFRHYQLTMSFAQHALVGSSIRSYLAWLKDAGRLSVRFVDCRMLWALPGKEGDHRGD
ncbi:MAG: MBL fold metallo-hydrolase [Oscillospiraceae bacterium]|nr:MBL fold metallo-hydrolase [Oscillospiraceae bacterium]